MVADLKQCAKQAVGLIQMAPVCSLHVVGLVDLMLECDSGGKASCWANSNRPYVLATHGRLL